MGTAIDRLRIKLAVAYVDPHVRDVGGVLSHVKGYFRKYETDADLKSISDQAEHVYIAGAGLERDKPWVMGIKQTPSDVAEDMARMAKRYGVPTPKVVVADLPTGVGGRKMLGETQERKHLFRRSTHTVVVPPEGWTRETEIHEMAHVVRTSQGGRGDHGDEFIGVYRSILRDEVGEDMVAIWDEWYDAAPQVQRRLARNMPARSGLKPEALSPEIRKLADQMGLL